MATSTIPVDLFNPGQVFACLGLIELTDALLRDARGGWDWSDEAQPVFHVSGAGDEDPVETALAFLRDADISTVAPTDSDLSTDKWKVPTRPASPAYAYPTPPPPSPATLSVRLTRGPQAVRVDHWGDGRQPDKLAPGRDNVKFWAGAAGYPGAAFLGDAIRAARLDRELPLADPLNHLAPMKSTFRFDWRASNIPLPTGFSTNNHASMRAGAYPLVEALAAIGLSHARPRRQGDKLHYRYAVIGAAETDLYDPVLLRAALGTAPLPFPRRMFAMQLDWPGQEGQARAITHVTEESS